MKQFPPCEHALTRLSAVQIYTLRARFPIIQCVDVPNVPYPRRAGNSPVGTGSSYQPRRRRDTMGTAFDHQVRRDGHQLQEMVLCAAYLV